MTNEENKYLEKLYELRKQRKADGLCVNCAKPLDREGYYCKKCNEKYNEHKYNYAHQNHVDNKYSTCAKPLDREGWLCTTCAKKRKLHSRERSAYRRENGLCVQCGRVTGLGSYCRRCLDMRMKRYRRKKESMGVRLICFLWWGYIDNEENTMKGLKAFEIRVSEYGLQFARCWQAGTILLNPYFHCSW